MSWTTRFLSYAGRLQLIKSVITSIVNFWQMIFRLPQGCLDKIEAMTAAFLWSGDLNNTSKSKVNWNDVCSPQQEGGLGLRKLKDMGLVFALSLIWRLFHSTNSLWVSWVQKYLLRGSSFWDIGVNTKGSWIWKKLLHLRPLASTFMRVSIGNGKRTHFWHDNWMGSGSLWDPNNPQYTRILGVSRNMKVAEVVQNGSWVINQPRNQELLSIFHRVTTQQLPSNDETEDIALWRNQKGEYKPRFDSTSTWNLVRTASPPVTWFKVVWFSQAIPRQSFILWLAFLNRLSTGDRMRNWGITQVCTFCGDQNETKEHLFFACPFSFQLWLLLARNLLPRSINPDWSITILSIQSPRRSKTDRVLLRMALQSAVYAIWRERNARIHTTSWKNFRTLANTIACVIRNKVLAYERKNVDMSMALRQRWDEVWSNGDTSLQI